MPEKSNPDSHAENPRRTKLFWIFAGAAFVVICAAYANHFHNGFHFDDSHTVINNVFIRDLHNTPLFFTDARTFSALARESNLAAGGVPFRWRSITTSGTD